MITLASIFRNSTSYLDRYFTQIAALRAEIPVRLVLAEGDSEDATGRVLRERVNPGDTVITVNHGGQDYGSIDHPTRWANIAKVVRAVIDEVGDPGEAFVYVESDLLWNERTIRRLVEADMPVAPFVLASDDRNRFYDTWGFRQNGTKFLGQPPYVPFPSEPPQRYEPIDSCGNCFVVPATDYNLVEEWDGTWPFTADGWLWVDTQVSVRHP